MRKKSEPQEMFAFSGWFLLKVLVKTNGTVFIDPETGRLTNAVPVSSAETSHCHQHKSAQMPTMNCEIRLDSSLLARGEILENRA